MRSDPLNPFAEDPAIAPPPGWEGLARWVRLYSIWQLLLVAIILWGAHFYALLGKPWTICLEGHVGTEDWSCIAYFHVYEAPMVALFLYQAWYGLRRFCHGALPGYFYLTLFQVILLVAFVTFESHVLLGSLARHAPARENLLLLAGCGGMVFGCVLGYYTVFHRLLPFFLTWRRDAGGAR